jgi:hypothetical protein
MAHCLSQAKVTEMSIMAMQTESSSTMHWDGIYNITLVHAKLQDHTKSNTSTKAQTNAHEQGRGSGRSAGRGQGGGTGRGGRTGRGPATSTANPDLVFTTVSGPNITMKANMKFQPEDWSKLTAAQKSQLRAAKGLPTLPTTPCEVHCTDVTPIATPIDSVSVVTEVTGDSLLRQTLSNKAARTPTYNNSMNQLNYKGSAYQRIANHVNICYHIQSASRQNQHGSIIDGSANGGMSGSDVRVIEQSLLSADVIGLADHAVKDIPISTVAGVLTSSCGKIIGIFHHYAHLGTGKTIHSANKMRHFGIEISDTPLTLAVKQRIQHPDGSLYPLEMYPPSDYELDTYPHVFLTSDET